MCDLVAHCIARAHTPTTGIPEVVIRRPASSFCYQSKLLRVMECVTDRVWGVGSCTSAREGGSPNAFAGIVIVALPFVDSIARAGGKTEIEQYRAATGETVSAPTSWRVRGLVEALGSSHGAVVVRWWVVAWCCVAAGHR